MGLTFNHGTDINERRSLCCPQWDYMGFGRFRRRLAEAEGFDLETMQGFSRGDRFEGDYVPGTRPWDEVTTDLKPLLNHSDATGYLTPAECAQVAPRLREVIAGWSDNDMPGFDYDIRSALALASCMETCVRDNTNLEFC
jgi:hypothetical protein